MSKTLIIVVATGVVVLLAGGIAWAKHRGACAFGGPEGLVKYTSDRLGLNEPQKTKLETFGQSLAGLRDQWRQKRRETKSELLSLLELPRLDRDKAAALIEQRQLAWREQGRELVDRFAEFSDSLSAEQREKLRTLIEERASRRWSGPGWSH